MIRAFLGVLCVIPTLSVSAQQDVYFTFTPVLTSDGSQIVFSFNSDLWKVSSNKTATRLTGTEEYLRISPDVQNIGKVGVKPDIFNRTTFEDRVKGRDPQLDKAIEEVLKQIKN